MKKIIFLVLLGFLLFMTGCDITEKKDEPEIITYTVTIYLNNGEENFELIVEKNDIIVGLNTPVKTDYEFKGWYIDNSLSNEFNLNTPITNDISIYAGWEEILSYDMIFRGFDDEILVSYEYNYNADTTDVIIPDAPVIEGYIFLGWDKPLSSYMPNNDVIYQAVYQEVRVHEVNLGGDDQRVYVYDDYILGIYREFTVPRVTLTILKISDESYRREIVFEGDNENSVESFHIYDNYLLVNAGLYDDEVYHHSNSLHIYNLEDPMQEEIISLIDLGQYIVDVDKVYYKDEFYMFATTDHDGNGVLAIRNLLDSEYKVTRVLEYNEEYGYYDFSFNKDYILTTSMDMGEDALEGEIVFNIYSFDDQAYHRRISNDYILDDFYYRLIDDIVYVFPTTLSGDSPTPTVKYDIYRTSDPSFLFEHNYVLGWGGPLISLNMTDEYIVVEQYGERSTGAKILQSIIIYDSEDQSQLVYEVQDIISYQISDNSLVYLAGDDEAPTLYVFDLENSSSIRTHTPPVDKKFTSEVYIKEDYIIVFKYQNGDGYSIFKLSDSDYRYEIDIDSNGTGNLLLSNLDMVTYDYGNEIIYIYRLGSQDYLGTIKLNQEFGVTHILTISEDCLVFAKGNEIYIVDMSIEAYK